MINQTYQEYQEKDLENPDLSKKKIHHVHIHELISMRIQAGLV